MKLPTLKQVLKLIAFPFYVVFVAFPNLIKHFIFLYFNSKIKVLRSNCIFLINPNSGLKLGLRLIQILKKHHREDSSISLFDPCVYDFIANHLNNVPKNERLIIVVCGGDGSVSSVVDNLETKLHSLDRCVFVPMPIGTGNDLSQILNFGCKMSVDFLYEYFSKLNSDKSQIVRLDTWVVNFKNDKTGETFRRRMLLYFGFGCDGRIIRKWDSWRRKYKFFFHIHVI